MLADDAEETGKTEAPPEVAEAPEDDSGGVTVAGFTISREQLPLVGMFVAAVILLTATLVDGSGIKYYEYSISVAAVAMFFSMLGFFLTNRHDDLTEQVRKFNAYFLFCWCFIGACILTFNGPFQVTGNAYFSAWGLAMFSVMALGLTLNSIKKSVAGLGALYGLAACSIIVIAAVSSEIRDDFYKNEGIYILVVACCTLVLVGALVYVERQAGEGESTKSMAKFVVLAFFAILWIVGASIVTFKGPFPVTGNGYFGSWGGAICSVFAAMPHL